MPDLIVLGLPCQVAGDVTPIPCAPPSKGRPLAPAEAYPATRGVMYVSLVRMTEPTASLLIARWPVVNQLLARFDMLACADAFITGQQPEVKPEGQPREPAALQQGSVEASQQLQVPLAAALQGGSGADEAQRPASSGDLK